MQNETRESPSLAQPCSLSPGRLQCNHSSVCRRNLSKPNPTLWKREQCIRILHTPSLALWKHNNPNRPAKCKCPGRRIQFPYSQRILTLESRSGVTVPEQKTSPIPRTPDARRPCSITGRDSTKKCEKACMSASWASYWGIRE